MKAFAIDRYGSRNGGRIREVADPALRDGDLLVKIHAASVNPLDLRLREGAFRAILPYRLPLILGNDFAGTVSQVGANVRAFKVGDEVYARPAKDRIGTFAELIAVSEQDVALKPANLTMVEAASLPLVGLTAWQALVERANLRAGQKVLIHAGAGGVGTIAIQLAKHLGATVATTTSEANIPLVKRLGADVVIDYKREAFETILSGYDVVLHTLDSQTLEKSVMVLKAGGKLISISGPPDAEFAKMIGLNWAMTQVLKVLSSRIRTKAASASIAYSFLFMAANGDQLRELAALAEAGVIKPVIDRVFSLEETASALDYVSAGRTRGKVVVKIL